VISIYVLVASHRLLVPSYTGHPPFLLIVESFFANQSACPSRLKLMHSLDMTNIVDAWIIRGCRYLNTCLKYKCTRQMT
jgi:hypothetical protein